MPTGSPERPTWLAEVEQVYRTADGAVSAVRVRFNRDEHATVSMARGQLSSADALVWENPERYGGQRYYCPGHGRSRVCPYGAHDEIRFPTVVAYVRAWLAQAA